MRTAIIGLQYGDEGKGRVSAEYGKSSHWFIRFNGGPNAGHTVYQDGVKFALHHLPAGAVMGRKVALDGGMVIDAEKLREELKLLDNKVDLYISHNVHLITGSHVVKDADGSGNGSTKRGIAPVYADRALRQGVRVQNNTLQLEGLNGSTGWKGYSGLPPIKRNEEDVIFESAQGLMIDVDYGCYPYVTSSSVFPGSQHKIDRTVGVFKAYTSRVGDGPPNRKLIPELTKRGDEFGTTTGRERKCYWNDLAELDYAMDIVRPDELVMTKVDILRQSTRSYA
jgi:adenylosuccinate synthase